MNADTKKIGIGVLVGAGSGDPKLITVAGADWLKKADVVIYDRLANPALLNYAPKTAELIYVGKKPDCHTLKQEQINQLLVDKVQQGNVVVRLKGGDPLIFGRGAEEVSALSQAGLDFRIIPGISAAISVGAYAGIPMTDREFASSFALVTGHEDPTKTESSVDFSALAKLDTVAFYMGVGNLPNIVAKLIEAGRNPETPAAIVQNATLPNQRTLVTTLNKIQQVADINSIKPPALIIIGNTCTRHDALSWFEKLPMFGQNILVTRSRTQQSKLADQLSELGANAIQAPTIDIKPVENDHDILQVLQSITENLFDWIVFTSPNGVEHFCAQCKKHKFDARLLAGVKIASVGAGTTAALDKHFITPDFMPAKFTTESLGNELVHYEHMQGKKVLLVRSDIAPEVLPDILTKAGADVTDSTFYITSRPESLPKQACEMLNQKRADWITFTSSSTVENMLAIVGSYILQQSKLASIGPVTSQALTRAGLTPTVEATVHTIAGLVDAIRNF